MTGFMCLKIEKEKTLAKCIYAASKQSLFMGRMQKQKLSKKQGDVIQMNRINEAHVYDKKQVMNRERTLTPNIMPKGTLSK